MFSIMKRPTRPLYLYNKKIQDYYINSTYESIKKKISKTDEERKTQKIVQLNLVTTPSIPNSTNPFIPVLVFLSISSLVYYFYNSKK
jgi:hypothetical protein